MTDPASDDQSRGKLSRRHLLAAGGVGLGVVAGAQLDGQAEGPDDSRRRAHSRVAFHSRYQAGIATPPQRYLHFAGFDLLGDELETLRDLLREWSQAAAALCQGSRVGKATEPGLAPDDPGEAEGLGPSSLTVTIGLGPSLFELSGGDRLGLRAQMPKALSPLPAFSGDVLDHARSDGDLCLQACADDPLVSFHAIHALMRLASGAARVRWLQAGFRSPSASSGAARNLLGFSDGVNNIGFSDRQALRRHVWVGAEGPPWMRGGTYLVARRIRMLFDVWDATSLRGQEQTIGRRKESGKPLATNSEGGVDLDATIDGEPAVPLNAHIRLAAPASNHGHRILRRSFSFSEGVDRDTEQLEAGLFFICFQRDPTDQFVPIQRRLAETDALKKHLLHTAGGLFACPPGFRPTGYAGERLFG